MNTLKISFFGILFFSLFVSCSETYIPRPYGYFRIELPEPEYRMMDTLNLPYRFEISQLAKVELRPEEGEYYWVDIVYPSLNGDVHCSYKVINDNLYELTEDSREMAYKHNVRADGIKESTFENPDKKVYAILYDLLGNTASTTQFAVTDSVRHFFRASLYFDNVPNRDSIAPVAAYVHNDLIRLIESFEWTR